MTLWLIGYGAWPVSKRAQAIVDTLTLRGVNRLVDVRLNPASSDVQEGRPYGPKAWNLQARPDDGLVGLLAGANIGYEWLVELGNPQRQDPEMAILRTHLKDPDGGWPVHRGLDRLAQIVQTPGVEAALLCACADWQTCHRTVVARAFVARASVPSLILRDVRTGQEIPAH